MADIKQRISLDGADDVASKLKRIGDTGQDAFRKLKEYSGPAGDGISTFKRSLEGEGSAHEIGEKLRESIHALHPVIEQAGLELGNLGAFARLAGAGMVPLGAAITGTVLVALAKLGEETQKSKARLKALGDEGGFEKISERAKALGVSVDSLQPRYEKFLAAQQRAMAQNRSIVYAPGFEPGSTEESAAGVRVVGGGRSLTPASREAFGQFDKSLFEEIRLDVKSAEDAARIAEEFETGLSRNGLTGDALRSLQESSPHAANFITRSIGAFLGFPNPNALGEYLDRRAGISIPAGLDAEQRRAYAESHPSISGVGANDLISEVAKHAPEADKEAESARGVTEAFEGLEAASKRLAEEMGGDAVGITKAIDAISHGVDILTENFDRKIGHPRDYEPGGPKFIGPVTPGERAEYNKPDILDVGKALLTGESDERFKDSNAIKAAKGLYNFNPLAALDTEPGNADTLANEISRRASGLRPLPNVVPPPSVSPPFIPDRSLDGLQFAPPAQEQQSQAAPAGGDVATAVEQSGDKQASILEQILAGIAALAGKANPDNLQQTGPAEPLGIRGATGGLATPAGFFDNGGHVLGAGTSTSDSIPAMLSNGEYVVKASSVKKAGLGFMNWLNAGHYADGGSVLGSILGSGNHQVTYDPQTGGAYVDGVLRLPGDPLLNDPIIKAAIERSKADMNADDRSRKHHSDFVGRFGHDDNADTYVAGGGLIGHFAGGGFVGHFAGGGAAFDPADHIYSPASGRSIDVSSGFSGGGSPWNDVPHLGSADLRTDHGDVRVVGPRDALSQISRAARDRANVRTGPSPSWRM